MRNRLGRIFMMSIVGLFLAGCLGNGGGGGSGGSTTLVVSGTSCPPNNLQITDVSLKVNTTVDQTFYHLTATISCNNTDPATALGGATVTVKSQPLPLVSGKFTATSDAQGKIDKEFHDNTYTEGQADGKAFTVVVTDSHGNEKTIYTGNMTVG